MTATVNATLQDILTPLANQLARIQEQITELQGDEAEIKAKIRSTVKGPDQYAAGNLTIVVSSNRRFDQKLALTLIAPEILPLVSTMTPVVDKDRMKVLAPKQYEASFTVYENKISLR